MAQRTPDARAKLVHYELSGLCSIKARLAFLVHDAPSSRPITRFDGADICSPARANWSLPEAPARKSETVILDDEDTIVLVEAPELDGFAKAPINPAASPLTIQARQE